MTVNAFVSLPSVSLPVRARRALSDGRFTRPAFARDPLGRSPRPAHHRASSSSARPKGLGAIEQEPRRDHRRIGGGTRDSRPRVRQATGADDARRLVKRIGASVGGHHGEVRARQADRPRQLRHRAPRHARRRASPVRGEAHPGAQDEGAERSLARGAAAVQAAPPERHSVQGVIPVRRR